MNNTLSCQLVNKLYIYDVELTEDLKRRLPVASECKELSNYFHLLLTQYPFDTLVIRAGIPNTDNFSIWFNYFVKSILPVLIEHRLPTLTHLNPSPIY